MPCLFQDANFEISRYIRQDLSPNTTNWAGKDSEFGEVIQSPFNIRSRAIWATTLLGVPATSTIEGGDTVQFTDPLEDGNMVDWFFLKTRKEGEMMRSLIDAWCLVKLVQHMDWFSALTLYIYSPGNKVRQSYTMN